MASSWLRLVILFVAACDGNGDPRVGGQVYGLAGPGMVVQNNGGDDLELVLNGAFAFSTRLAPGSAYDVTVLAPLEDPRQVCTVTGGTGVVGDGDVDDIRIDCQTPGVRELSASLALVASGQQVALTWASTQATSCTLDPPVAILDELDFGTADIEVDAATQYTFSCDAGGSIASTAAAVLVTDTDWLQVASANEHTCAIKTDGRLFCWGWNLNGELGSGEFFSGEYVESLPAVQEVTGASDWAQVAAASSRTCAIKTDGRLFCWGNGANGGLGTGDQLDTATPLQEITGATDWAQVAMNYSHTCAVKTDGRLFCWGWNQWDQLGNPGVDEFTATPVPEASAASDWATVSTGKLHTCATKTNGRLFCWGSAGPTPTEEATAATDWSMVSASDYHTCAIKTDGRLFCWGDGQYGQLGTGSTASSSTPVQEATAATDWVSVATNGDSTCARKSDGRLFCWGWAESAALGNSALAPSTTPVQESTGATDWRQVSRACAIKDDGSLYCWGRWPIGVEDLSRQRSTPTQEQSLRHNWDQVATDSTRTCGITRDGRLFCWGMQFPGLLADLHPWSDLASLIPVQEATGASDWAQVDPGGGHTCALKQDGRVFCTGGNERGQLGDGTTTSTFGMVAVAGGTTWERVSTGGLHTCAIDVERRLFCWGAGDLGQLGSGDTDDSAVPVQEDSHADDWATVSAGVSHTCATKTDGRLFCWGAGGRGRLGNDSTDNRDAPVQEASGAENWANVSAGAEHTCAIRADGRLFCWGSGDGGALGIGAIEDHATPVQEMGAAIDWRQVSAGAGVTCAIRMDQSLYCWGSNSTGQLGNGSGEDSLVPVQEADGAHTWASVSVARAGGASAFVCATREGGRLFCWGSDVWGQLGVGSPPMPVPPAEPE